MKFPYTTVDLFQEIVYYHFTFWIRDLLCIIRGIISKLACPKVVSRIESAPPPQLTAKGENPVTSSINLKEKESK